MHDPTTLAQCLLVVVVGGPKMKAHPLHHSVHWLTFVSAQTQFSSGSHPNCKVSLSWF